MIMLCFCFVFVFVSEILVGWQMTVAGSRGSSRGSSKLSICEEIPKNN